jgi:hypothetical protein
MSMFCSYDDAGKVITNGRGTNPQEQAPEQGGVYEGAQFDGDEFYFVDHVPTRRPAPPAIELSATEVVADGEATIELTGVPPGAKIIFGGHEVVAEGLDITLSTDLIGANRIIVEAWPAKRWTGTFNGVAAINAPAP